MGLVNWLASHAITFVIGVLGVVIGALLANYLVWAGEIRRRGLEALLDLHAAIVSATEDVRRFMGHWRGFRAVSFEQKPNEPRPDLTELGETHGKLVKVRQLIDRVSPLLDDEQKDTLIREWAKLWDGFHDSGGDDVKKDLAFQEKMWEPTEQVASVIKRRFMGWRGFFLSVFRW
jgi:hypothetical protein